MEQFKDFFIICAYAVGAIGGIGYALHSHAYLIAVCVGVLAVLAFPEVKKAYKNLIG